MKAASKSQALGQQQQGFNAAFHHHRCLRAMRTRARAASPGPDQPPTHRSGTGSTAPGHHTGGNIHSRLNPSGPGSHVQPLQVSALEREIVTEPSSEWPAPKLSLLQRLGRLRRSAGLAKLADFKIMGLELSPELVAISMVYFVQGILGLSRLAVSYFFKDELHIEPAEVAVLTGLSSIPWMIKPLYGFISDSIPLFGYRRRSYLVLCGLMGTGAWATLAYGVHDVRGAVACMLLASLGTAASDVVVDSIVVERARGHHQSVAGSLQSLCWASAALGGIASAYFSGSFVQDYGCRFVFGVTAFFPLAVSASAMLIDERPVGYVPPAEPGRAQALLPPRLASPGPASTIASRMWGQSVALWGAVRRKDILLPAIFVFLWQATPSAESAMFYYQTNVLAFTPEFLGWVRLGGSLASLAGVAIFNSWLKTVPLRRLLWWVLIVGTVLSSSQLVLVSGLHRQWGLSDQLFVLGDSMVLTVLGQISFMPILVLAARMCPEGVEATLFATLMSVLNCGSITGGALGAGLTKLYGVTSENYDNLFPLVATCVVLTLAPAPFLSLLPEELDEEKERGEGEGGEAGRPAGQREAVTVSTGGAAKHDDLEGGQGKRG